MRYAIGLVAACLSGIVIAWLFQPSPDSSIQEELRSIKIQIEELSRNLPRSEPRGGINCAAVVDANSIREELRRALEIKGAGVSRKDGSCECPSEDEYGLSSSSAPKPEALAALQHGRDLIDRSLSRGSWGDEQAQEFRLIMSQLDKDSSEELLKKLIPAMNEGRVRVETAGPPF